MQRLKMFGIIVAILLGFLCLVLGLDVLLQRADPLVIGILVGLLIWDLAKTIVKESEKKPGVWIHDGKTVRLKDLPNGAVFRYNGRTALKTKFLYSDGMVVAYIIGTGEVFENGKSADVINNFMVQPLRKS